MSARNQFIDPAGVLDTYSWHINHGWDGEQQAGLTRHVEYTPTTSTNKNIRQQGGSDPVLTTLSGTILDPAQLDQFDIWTAICEDRTIYYKEFTGLIREVFITVFTSAKKGVMRNPRGGTRAPHHTWEWSMTMEIISVIEEP